MTNTAIAADLHETTNILSDLLAEVPLDPALVLYDLADPPCLVLGEILDLGRILYLGLLQDFPRPGPTYAIDVCQANPDLFVLGKVYPRNSSHRLSLSLALLVFRILTDHPHHAMSADDLALRTHSFYR
jgi:hypothetical protein